MVLLPLNGTELQPNGILVWSEVPPVNNSGPVSYILQIDDDSTFNSTEISHSGITEYLYSKANHAASIDVAVNLKTNAITIMLNNLDGFENLIDNKIYFWRVKAVDNYNSESDYTDGRSYFFFNKTNTTPLTVVDGFSPKEGLEIRTNKPEISWHPATDLDMSDHTGTLHYNLQLDDDSNFSNGHQYQYETQEGLTTFEVPDSLSENHNWFYRVQTVDDEDLTSDWSTIQNFWVNAKDEPPFNFSLITPADHSTIKADSILLHWQTAIDPDPNDQIWYSLEIGIDSLFSGIPQQVVLQDSIYLLSSTFFEKGKTYFWRVKGVDSDSLETFASNSKFQPWRFTWDFASMINEGELNLPEAFQLSQNYPNPFNPATTIRFQIPVNTKVTIKIFNILGQEIYTLLEEEKPAGNHSIIWDGKDSYGKQVPSGVYIYQMRAGDFIASRKLILMR